MEKKADCSPSKKTSTSDALDRISNLPSGVLTEILQYVPIREAVRASILSRDWRHQWRNMTQLAFDAESYPPNSDKLLKHQELVHFVNSVILPHNGKITYFRMDAFLDSCPEVDQWISILSKKMMRVLILVFNQQKRYEVPASLFACESLVSLKLGRCVFTGVPSQFSGFLYLSYLYLHRVKLTNEILDGLLVKLPVLYMIQLFYCKGLPHISFNAPPPKLKIFSFKGGCTRIKLQNAPNLEQVNVQQWISPQSVKCRLEDVLVGLYKLRRVVIFHPFLETAPEKFKITFRFLTQLNVSIDFKDPKQMSVVICLCRSAPKLRSLSIIWDSQNTDPEFSYDEMIWNDLMRKKEVFKSLKTMSFYGFMGAPHQMRFTGLILYKALSLERFTIRWLKTQDPNTKDSIMNKVMQLQKTSTKAKVIFLYEEIPCILVF